MKPNDENNGIPNFNHTIAVIDINDFFSKQPKKSFLQRKLKVIKHLSNKNK